MTGFTPDVVPLSVRIRNNRYDGMLTGYIHGAPQFETADVGGFMSASFIVDRQLGFRDELIQPYSRVYFYDTRTGECVFEGDTEHAGRSNGTEGALLEVQVKGSVGQLEDWQGQRIYIDRDIESWMRTSTANTGSQNDAGEDRGGSGADALTLAFPNSFHVELNYRGEMGYYLMREAGQELGWVNYSWDAGITSGSPGWLVRCITTPPSTLTRSQILSTGGSGGSGAVVGGSIPVGANVAFLQLIWTGGSSSTGTSDDIWVSLMNIVVQCRFHEADGTFLAGSAPPYSDYVTAPQVINDLLGTVLASSYDGPGARVDVGSGYQIRQLAYPGGVNPKQILDDLMTFEGGCTYQAGPSNPVTDLYELTWMERSNLVRYEFSNQVDEYSAGPQSVDQFSEAVTRYKSPNGLSKSVVSSQSIPEMTNMGRVRRIFQDLGDDTSDAVNAGQANLTILADHRFPANGGQVIVRRPVVDLWTGRTVDPYSIKPGYVARIVGIGPSRDALNSSPRNGSTLCRIITNNYDGAEHSASIALDQESWSMYRAIAKAKKGLTTPPHRSYPSR